jgi:DegV family protein with EDD domain
MTVAIVTDSGSDLTPQQLAESKICQVPLSVAFADRSFLCPDELPPEEFWKRMTAPETPFPHTSTPSAGQFKEAFEKLFAEGAEAIVGVFLSETLSSTIKSAEMAREMLPGKQIELVDSRSASMAIGSLALHGARMARSGASAAAIAEALRLRRERITLFVALETLEYLRKGGRISAAEAAIGGLLAIKPIITVEDGIVVTADKPRTRSKAHERVIELLTDRPVEEVHVLHSPPADDGAFRETLLAHMPKPEPKLVTSEILGPIIGTHIGPGAYGAVLIRAE